MKSIKRNCLNKILKNIYRYINYLLVWMFFFGKTISLPSLLCFHFSIYLTINPIQDGGGGGGQKAHPPTSYSPATSTNVGFGHQHFLTFSFNPFATLVQNFKFVPSASPKLLNLNQDHPSKKAIFLVKSL